MIGKSTFVPLATMSTSQVVVGSPLASMVTVFLINFASVGGTVTVTWYEIVAVVASLKLPLQRMVDASLSSGLPRLASRLPGTYDRPVGREFSMLTILSSEAPEL